MTNWKKEYEESDEKYWKLRRSSWDKSEKLLYSISGTILTIFLTCFVLYLFGAFNNPVQELGLDREELVREYTLVYYPEFENCSIEYGACIKQDTFSCIAGVKIYCNELDNRDDFKVEREKRPTEILHFDDINLKDILLHKIRSCQ